MEGKSLQTSILISAFTAVLGSTLKALLSSTRLPWKRMKDPIVKRLEELKRRLPYSSPLAERVAKIAVIVVFTVGWRLIVLVRSFHLAIDPTAIDCSSLLGLATALQQRTISTRHFQTLYGPGAQLPSPTPP